MASPAEGTLLAGKYRLVRPLSAGGMGSVWVARHVELDVDVAVKLISWVQALRPVAVERFKREARAAAQIRSPHVVQILDYGVHDGVPYMAMELLAGQDLAEYIERQGRVAPARALEILRPVCKALGLAHQAGIVHRDIKPANIFLATVGEDEVVKVLDFGIAKETSREAQHTTGSGLVGSPLYMSPEQMRGSDVDLQTDVWSVSVALFELLAGSAPFTATGLPELFRTVGTTDAPPMSEKVSELAAFDDFFRRGLAREKSERFASMRDLLGAFEEACAGAPAATVVVPSVRASPLARRAGASTEALAPTAEVAVTRVDAELKASKVETLDALADLPSSGDMARPDAPGSRKSVRNVVIGIAALGALGVGIALYSRGPGGDPGVGARAEPTASSPVTVAPVEEGSETAKPGALVAPSPSAEASAVVSATASATASVAVPLPPASGRPAVRGPATAKPTAAPQAGQSSTTDPIWGVEVSKPKR